MPEVRQTEKNLLLLGEAFRGIREQHGVSAGELAGATDVEETRIAELEAGRAWTRTMTCCSRSRKASASGPLRSSLRAEELGATAPDR